jgi:hypothetical protein
MTERGAEVMAAMLDIFDQEKVWDMALKAECREGLEQGLKKEAASIIRLCRRRMHMPDPEVIRTLMEEMNLSQDRASEYLAGYDHPVSESDE